MPRAALSTVSLVLGLLLAASASALYAKNLLTFLEALIDKKTKELAVNWDDEIVKGTVLTRDRLTAAVGEYGLVTQRAESYRRAVDEHLLHLPASVRPVSPSGAWSTA